MRQIRLSQLELQKFAGVGQMWPYAEIVLVDDRGNSGKDEPSQWPRYWA